MKEAPHWLQWNGLSPAKPEQWVKLTIKALSKCAEEQLSNQQPGRPEAFMGSAVLSLFERESHRLTTKHSALDVTPNVGSDRSAAGGWTVTRKDQLHALS